MTLSSRNADSLSQAPDASSSPWLAWGREVLKIESESIRQLADRLDGQFLGACQQLINGVSNSQQVIVTGMGKAGLVGQKVTATLASTGTQAQFLHPSEAIHGDLGKVSAGDTVLAFSNSGETEEVVRLLPSFRDLGAELIAVTATESSTLGRFARWVLSIGKLEEACPLGLAPSATTAAMIALGDALALVVSRARGFASADFARYHPGGALGRKLARVEDVMRPIHECRVALETLLLSEVLTVQSHLQRRTGATMLVDESGRLTGLFTDSDLVRRIARGETLPLDAPVSEVMTPAPKSAPTGCRMAVALEILAKHKISELPIIDDSGRPQGLIDVTDVVELLPQNETDPPSPTTLAGEIKLFNPNET